MNGHAPMNAAMGGARFVLGEIVAGVVAQENEDLLHLVFLGGSGAVAARAVLLKAAA